MTDIHLSDENLMAYADGEAEAPLQRAVERAMLADPRAVRKVVDFLRSRRLARAALALDGTAVPDSLRAAVEAKVAAHERQGGNVVPLKRRGLSGLWARVALPVAAAAVLLAAVSLYTTMGMREDAGSGVSLVAHIEAPRVQHLLDRLPAGSEETEDGVTLRALATYRLPSGRICRAFSLTQDAEGAEAVSCREGERWAFTVAGAVEPQAYVPADGTDVIGGYLAGAKAGEALSEEEEARLFAELKR
ncbi:hypothetical protein GCM10007276_34900 [Agaricicola taiwanensis]|uniref:Anti-sigma factor n=1 Tax=Agaricicola taiwanensis TaxID=591372 RepID=A0A8J3DZF6_9RHOB|nr:hypothetical protein [Agaricicola taiwanensis]GGE54949.1 hypothetical protein GCM10007276_34900 [Agaricicola taiwanensis]